MRSKTMTDTNNITSLLPGYRVLDLTSSMGAFCGKLLLMCLDLRQSALAGQGFAGPHLTAEHFGNDLVEYVLGYRAAIDGLQWHPSTIVHRWPDVKWPDQ